MRYTDVVGTSLQEQDKCSNHTYLHNILRDTNSLVSFQYKPTKLSVSAQNYTTADSVHEESESL